MSVVSRIAFLSAISTAIVPSLSSASEQTPTRTQYVIVSFDGAHEISQWERSRLLSERTGAHFTYFLSCVFLLSRDVRSEYRPPRHTAGRSQVGFAQTKEEVAERLRQIQQAAREGHEIASHGCGHFEGKDWSKQDWQNEFAEFRRIMADAYTINGLEGEPSDWKNFTTHSISGFRAPYLSTNKGLFEALVADGFSYDASAVSRGPAEPESRSGLVHFALPQIPEGPKARPVIAMDYNLFVRHSGGVDRAGDAEIFRQRTVDAFRAAFENEYNGSRTPLQMGFHFTLMNGGAYWDALEVFVTEVCGKADVVCTSYSDYLKRTTPTTGQPDKQEG